MEADSGKKRISALAEEMDAIHSSNSRYWKQGSTVTSEERAEYQQRQDRLEEIRKELAELRRERTEP
jgi:transposase-like protein